MVRFPSTVDEAFEINPPVRVESPFTARDASVPREVSEELTTVEPRVVAESIAELFIKYERPDAILISFEA